MVPDTGLEPVRIAPRDFKSLVSTIPPTRRIVSLIGLEPITLVRHLSTALYPVKLKARNGMG